MTKVCVAQQNRETIPSDPCRYIKPSNDNRPGYNDARQLQTLQRSSALRRKQTAI